MNLLHAAESAGLVLKKVASTKGGEYAGPCPGCGGLDRFRCWPEDRGGQGSFWCRRCGKWGDLVQFLVEFCGYNYPDAFKTAGREKPLDYPPKDWGSVPQNTPRKFEPRIYAAPNSLWKEKALKLVENAHKKLLQTDSVLEYLEKRGLDIMAIKQFNLGWFPGEAEKNCMFRPRSSWGLPPMKKPDGKDKILWLPRGIIIPCFKDGDIYRIRIRRPKEDIQSKSDIKYFVVPGSGMDALYLNPERKAFVVVESELDGFLIARKAGSLVGVVALGNAQMKPSADIYFSLKKALKILVSLDWDEAGQKAWQWWQDNFNNSKLWPVPEGKDPGEAFQLGTDIHEWIKTGLPPVFTFDEQRDYLYPSNFRPPENLYPIQELKFFLKKLPIEIVADKDRHKIIFSPGLRNKQIRERVKQLFFEDDEVFYYLKLIHPAAIIHGGNIDYKQSSN